MASDILKIYLDEMGRTPLISPAEEGDLARRIRRGDKAALAHLISANLRLVVHLARAFTNRGLPLLDLISEGNIGLAIAAKRFDPRKGAKLSTYAMWWIKQRMQTALSSQAKTIRIPVGLSVVVAKMRRATNDLTDALGREPTDAELAAELRFAPGKIAHLRSVGNQPVSLDAQLDPARGAGTLGEIIADAAAVSPLQELTESGRLEDLRRLLGELPPRSAAILNARFGLDGGNGLTLDRIGRKHNVSRERIRQIERESLTHLRKRLLGLDRDAALKAEKSTGCRTVLLGDSTAIAVKVKVRVRAASKGGKPAAVRLHRLANAA